MTPISPPPPPPPTGGTPIDANAKGRGVAPAPTRPGGWDARRIAHAALVTVQRRPVFVSKALDELLAAHPASPAERAFATEIANGVTRRKLTLEALLAPHLRRPADAAEPALWALLQIGAYQLVFLATAAHAAIHETVELARRLDKPRWVPFVNAVLRALQRDLTDEEGAADAADAVPLIDLPPHAGEHDALGEPGPALQSEPSSPEVRFRKLRRPCFASPVNEPGAYFSAAYSLPRWLIGRWIARLGRDETQRLAAWFNTPGHVSLRINPLRANRADVLAAVRAAGFPATLGTEDDFVRLDHAPRIEQLPGFAEGLFSVQDESAMAGVRLLDPQPGRRVLDLCAAPGGKTTHLAERMQNRGSVTATDTHAARLERVNEAARRLGLTIIATQQVAVDSSDVPAGPFDGILVDAPCSNTGVLGKRPEARWRISEDGIGELSGLQRRLLIVAAQRLAPGGRLVYSTCSIEPEENERVVQSVLEARPELALQEERRHLPGRPADGGYQALLIRSKS